MTLPDVQMHLHALVNSSTRTVRSNWICMPYNFRTYLASALRYSSTTHAVDHSSRDWYGLRASGSDTLYRIAGLAGTISKRTHVRV